MDASTFADARRLRHWDGGPLFIRWAGGVSIASHHYAVFGLPVEVSDQVAGAYLADRHHYCA